MEFDALLDPLHSAWLRFGAFLPSLAFAIVVVIAGWLLAKMARFAVVKALRAINFNVLTEKAGIDGFIRQGGGELDTTQVLGLLIYWLVILAALMIAFNSMGLSYVTDLVGRVLLFVPRVIVAVVILAFGAYLARFVGAAVATYGKGISLPDAMLIGRLAFWAVLIFVVLVALDQLGLGDIIRQSFLILLAAIALALALAFGLGGQKRAAEWLERWSRQREEETREESRRARLR
jgi:Conserved TM helix